jgi:hypothetical protein
MAGAAALPLGSLRVPGPGFLPLGIGAAMAIFSIASIVEALQRRDEPGPEFSPAGALRLVTVVCGIVGYILLLPVLGFRVATVALLFGLFGLGSGQWLSWRNLGAALVATAFCYLLFERFLQIGLPEGSLLGF